MQITLIGLGLNEGELSGSAKAALSQGAKIFARTAQSPSYRSLGGYDVQPLDDLFTSSRNFDTLNKKLADTVIKQSKLTDVIYCVDGAVCEDNACKIILSCKKDVKVIEGPSKTSYAVNLAGIKTTCVSGVSAYDIKNLKPSPAAVVYDIDCYYIASEVKIALSDLYGEEADCTFICGGKAVKIKIYEIDRQKDYDMTCAVAVEESDFLVKDRYDYNDVLNIVRVLRAPGGCPWDRAQTNESIRQNMIEEAYELVDAIIKNDDDMLWEETGDVLLQAAFHTVLKEEQGAFTSQDVTTRLVKKLIFRHSHIFGKDKAADENSALGVWDKNKEIEKKHSTYGESVAAVPDNFPACMRAQKVQKRASKAGLDYLSAMSAADKLTEDTDSCINALLDGKEDLAKKLCGDMLFDAVSVCRLAGADSEQALTERTAEFAELFIKAEEIALSEGKNVKDFGELEWNWYLLRAKNAIKEH
ncbi:MAG: nucleoside triphosphate pyrophosphohydrolase [Clostridia bacterium]|nr:nucleoside triphosphate pyrophosphohydrolase [Clostridia bacterium]